MPGQDETRQRVLDIAAHLFAERGFRKVTVREICRKARANVAAVNYHFGDKAGLYGEVIDIAIQVMRQTNEEARNAASTAAPPNRLRAHIRVYLERLLSNRGNSWLHKLMTRELADPTSALDAIVARAVRPRVDFLCSVVREIVGPAPTDAAVFDCVASVQAQCVMLALPNPIADRLRGHRDWSPAEIDQLADHISEFSLAGIRAIGRRRPTRRLNDTRSNRSSNKR